MSNVEPWQGHKKPPTQSGGSEGCAPGVNFSVGEQPRCEQMPTTTRYSLLMERHSLRVDSIGVISAGLRWESGSATRGLVFSSEASCSGVRRTIHTGLPRH